MEPPQGNAEHDKASSAGLGASAGSSAAAGAADVAAPAPNAPNAAALASDAPSASASLSLRSTPPPPSSKDAPPLARHGPPDKVCHRQLQGHVGHERSCATASAPACATSPQPAPRGDEPVQASAAPPVTAAAAPAAAPAKEATPASSSLPPPAMEAAPAPAPDSYEATHVHAVYEAIAPHFSATRHRPWPLVSRYLADQRPGAVGFDVGCGNGKYLSARDLDPSTATSTTTTTTTTTTTNTTTTTTTPSSPSEDVLMLGCDRSANLIDLARTHAGRPREVLVADGLSLPFRPHSADFCLCIAVVHHLSTRERRVAAVAELLRCLRKKQHGDASGGAEDRGGTALVFVWALEQASSRRGWDEGGDQDLLVPWVMKGDQGSERKKKKAVVAEGGAAADDAAAPTAAAPEKTFQRYYHLYRKGELEEDVAAAGGIVLDSGYERDNWWAICARGA